LKLRFDRFEATSTFGVFPLRTQEVILGWPWLAQFEPEIDYPNAKIRSYPYRPNIEPPLPGIVNVSFISARSFEREIADGFVGAFVATASVTGKAMERMDHVPKAFHDYRDVFSDDPKDAIPPHRPFDHRIPLEPDSAPPFGPIYKLSPAEMEVLHDYIQNALATGAIQPSESSAGAPILFVKKKDGSLRLCVDYRGLNKITKKNRYPLPLISDLLDRLGKARYFSKIDLRNAYHQIRIADGDEWKTAFRTRYGLFEYRVMPFGLTTAPASFQNLINSTFSDMLDRFVIAYLDDILIYSETLEEHEEHIRRVLQRLRDNKLFARPEKCEFYSTSVAFLGYIVSHQGVSMDPSKVQAIADWPIPTTLKHVQSFLGFCNFYRQFIKGYSIVATPLTDLTKGDGPFKWTQAAQAAFEALKLAFESADILRHADPSLPYILETDASDFGMGAVLSQEFPDGIRPIAFFSKKFSPAELNYTVHNKELLAIVSALLFWRSYLEGAQHPVRIITDHQPLIYFTTKRLLDRQQARWSVDLQRFVYTIEHRPGKHSEKPDALSRRADHELTADDLAHSTRPLLSLGLVRLADITIGSAVREMISLAQEADSECQALIERLRNDSRRPGEQHYSVGTDGFVRHKEQLYVPDYGKVRLRIVEDCHNGRLAGHPGRTRTLQLVRRYYYWPRIKEFIADFVASCDVCNRSKHRRRKPQGQLRSMPTGTRAWGACSVDFIVHLPTSNSYNAICVMVDSLTKNAKFEPCRATVDAPELADCFLRRVIAQHGIPSSIVSDRGTQFTSFFWRSLNARLGTSLQFSTSDHPRTDGQTEIVNQWLDTYLRIYCCYQQDDWCDLLPLAEFAYNSATHSSTGKSPFFWLYGFNPRGPDDGAPPPPSDDRRLNDADGIARAEVLRESLAVVREQAEQAKAIQKKYYDEGRVAPPPFKVDDWVYLDADNINLARPSVKLSPKFVGPYKIIEQISPVNFRLDLPERLKIFPIFHVELLKPKVQSKIPGRTQSPPPPEMIDDNEEWEVDEILDSKGDPRRRRDAVRYLVQWLGHDEPTWEPISYLTNAMERLHSFHRRYPKKPRSRHYVKPRDS
jgi:hypothetical protein